MIEQDTIARVHVVSFTIIDGNPVCVELGHTVGTARIERRGLALRSLDDLAVEFGSGSLVEADVLLQTDGPDGVEETKGAERVNVA